jgi:NTP pyrophosphatase (non-canonical NTP hydrolase)
MDFQIYQAQALRTAKPLPVDDNLVHTALGVTGEAGEYADAIKKHVIYGKPLDQENAIEELGDILWFIALACEALGTDMASVAQGNIDKLKKRYPEKYTDQLAGDRLDKASTENADGWIKRTAAERLSGTWPRGLVAHDYVQVRDSGCFISSVDRVAVFNWGHRPDYPGLEIAEYRIVKVAADTPSAQ